MGSGVHDVRLFRDGRLVARWPRTTPGRRGTGVGGGREDLTAWRARSAIELDPTGTAVLTDTVRLARTGQPTSVVFSAYAFNADRVKSETRILSYQSAEALSAARRRAYLVAIGVSDNEDLGLKLTFAARDARTTVEALAAAIARAGTYDEVVRIPLLTRPPPNPAGLRPDRGPTIQPTKANLRAVFDVLAGRTVDPALRAAIESVSSASVRAAAPHDLVLVYYAGHGTTDAAGREFYLLPYDVGREAADEATVTQLRRSVSSEEIGAWLSEVDADPLVLVLSTCYSESAIEREGFKPGPMGDRGLGQLSYDKGMQVLVAAESKAVDDAGRSLLSEALLQGLRAAPAGGVAALESALRFAERRVPTLVRERGDRLAGVVQAPTLFDFRRRGPTMVSAGPEGGPR